ncbi:Myotubularin-related protein 3 [Nymphon striatum]|nr:Myotubularin-related protein 3 [Nymphon striatum]KAG1681496.1 Myotubularin-related protein 3 [Nymphon striatum]
MEDQVTEEENEPQSMEAINAASELFPIKPTSNDDELVDNSPFTTLCGEYISHVGLTTDGVIAMSNYRLFVKSAECGIFNVPLFMIEQVDASEYDFWVRCKNLHLIRQTLDPDSLLLPKSINGYQQLFEGNVSGECCKFSSSNRSWTWYQRINSVISCVKKIEDLFAFAFYSWCCQDKEEFMDTLQYGIGAIDMDHEMKRLGFDCYSTEENKTWRITNVNADYSLCSTYPSHIIVPNNISDEVIASGAKFRSSKRFPAVVWRSRKNGCVIARCSQPEVGLLGWRGKDDEELVQAIAQACQKSVCSEDGPAINEQNEIVLNNALCQQARNQEWINPEDILMTVYDHLKDTHQEFALATPKDKWESDFHNNNKIFGLSLILWLTTLDSSKWLHYLSALLQSAKCVVNAINNEKRPVIVHCSDGWDRTPQITALAELLLDPHYRTIEGFQILIEREWLQFGHKFGDRCGYSINEDLNERSPVFLQWLDCVHQLLIQYPCYFEFNEAYLVKLAQHIYSCLFGTFLCNNESARYNNKVRERTFSLWSFFRSYQTHFKNYLFTYVDKILYPRCYTRDLVFWSNVYSPYESSRVMNAEDNEVTTAVLTNGENCTSSGLGLVKTKSCDDLSVNEQNINMASTKQRRLSDPSSREIQCAIANNQASSVASQSAEETKDFQVSKEKMARNPEESENQISGINGLEVELTKSNSESVVETDLMSPEIDTLSITESSSSFVEDGVKNKLFSGVNGSTDTLVSENGTDSLYKKICCDNSYKNNKQSCDDYVPENDEIKVHRMCKGTSTSEISDSCVLADACGVSFKQSWPHIIHRGLTQSCLYSSQKPKIKPFSRKTNNSSSLNSIYSNSLDSRTPSSGFPATPNEECKVLSDQGISVRSISKLEDIDGLNVGTDSVQLQLIELLNKHKSEIESLKQELYAVRLDMCQQLGNKCNNNNNNGNTCPDHGDEVVSLPDSIHSGEICVGHESNDTECNWEHVNDKELRSSLLTSEHAGPNCSQYGTDY